MKRCIRYAGVALIAIHSWAVAQGILVPDCKISDPVACPNTNFLVNSRGFAAALERFSGHHEVRYFAGESRRIRTDLTEQALEGLGGPPEDAKRLPGNLLLFAACPAHDCGGQGTALIVSAGGGIEALGFSSVSFAANSNESVRKLDFYLRNTPQASTLVDYLMQWGNNPRLVSYDKGQISASDSVNRAKVHYLP